MTRAQAIHDLEQCAAEVREIVLKDIRGYVDKYGSEAVATAFTEVFGRYMKSGTMIEQLGALKYIEILSELYNDT